MATRCEGWRRYGGAFTFGPVVWKQCEDEATVMLKLRQEMEEVKDFPSCHTCWQEAVAKKIEILKAEPINVK